MNSSSSLLIAFSCTCILIGMANPAKQALAQAAHDTTEVVRVPIDTERSVIIWRGTEMWQSGKHEGTVSLKKGHLSYRDRKIIGGHFVADMSTIAITDIPEHEPVPRQRLSNHLKSADFFYVEKHPTAQFEITNTEMLETGSIRVWGDLSIRDITKVVSFTASQKVKHDDLIELHTSFSIDRFDWNISYQGSYWARITSILDNTFVDADILLSVKIVISSTAIPR